MDMPSSHEGIELDTIDLTGVNQASKAQKPSFFLNGRIDYKAFVKHIFKNLQENDAFLSFSGQITDVNKILNLKYSSANDIADVILKDMALTSKLLKLVNSSFYGQFSHKGIKTISEAMIILGTEEIRQAAASLKIYELMQDVSNLAILKKKTLKALQRSLVAHQVAKEENIKDAEGIQISAMLYDFGEYLVALFAPEVFLNIEILVDDKDVTKEKASKEIIGISYSELGRFVASKWHLPASVIQIMRPVTDFKVKKQGLNRENQLRYICSFSNDLCAIEFSDSGENVGKDIMQISNTYKSCLDIPAPKCIDLLKVSWNKIAKHASILKLDMSGA